MVHIPNSAAIPIRTPQSNIAMKHALLVVILESVTARCIQLEASLGKARAARLVGYAMRGFWPIEAVFRNWVDGVAMEHTRDPDTLRAVRILLALFIVEVKAIKTLDHGKFIAFSRLWVARCFQILEADICVDGDLVFFSPDKYRSA